MKTHLRFFLICTLIVCCASTVLYASNSSGSNIDKAASKIVNKWVQNIQLTTEQQALFLKKTTEYLHLKNSILKKEENSEEKELSEEQKMEISKASFLYKEAIDSLLTEKQKETIVVKRKKQNTNIENKNKVLLNAKIEKMK